MQDRDDQSTQPLFSVCICTRNRADSLARTLRSLSDADIGADWEVLIVDNGSSDHTADVAARFSPALPIRSVIEQMPGLSHARNRALAQARGRFIVWTDDDVLVDPNFLAAYRDAFLDAGTAAIFGGKARPVYEGDGDPWMRQHEDILQSMLAIRDEPQWTEVTPERIPFGLNFAVKAAVARNYRFDPALGVAPGRRTGGEETAFIRQMLSDGETGRWVWDAEVRHIIPAARQSLRYTHDYYRAHGQLFPLMPAGEKRRSIASRLTCLSKIGLHGMKFLFWTFRGDADRAMSNFLGLARWRGTMDTLSLSSGALLGDGTSAPGSRSAAGDVPRSGNTIRTRL